MSKTATAVKTALAEKAAGQTNKPMTPEQTIRQFTPHARGSTLGI